MLGQFNARRLPQTQGNHTRTQWLLKFAACHCKCHYCELPLTVLTTTKDHLTPLCREGSDDIENIVPACRPCNLMKSWRTEAEFIRDYPRLSARFSQRARARENLNPHDQPRVALEEQLNQPGLLKTVVREREQVSWFWRNPA